MSGNRKFIGRRILLVMIVLTLIFLVSSLSVGASSTGTPIYFKIGDFVISTQNIDKGNKRSLPEPLPPPEKGTKPCSFDSDCSMDAYCNKGDCVPVICDCGEISYHECYEYECCSSYDCSDKYSTCENHECVEREYSMELLEDELLLGQEATLLIYGNEDLFVDGDVSMRLPSDDVINLKTNSKGEVNFIPELIGDYELSLFSKDGKLLLSLPMSVRKQGLLEHPEILKSCCLFGKCDIFNHSNFFGVCWYWVFVSVIILVLFGVKIVFRYFIRKMKFKSKKHELIHMLKNVKHK